MTRRQDFRDFFASVEWGWNDADGRPSVHPIWLFISQSFTKYSTCKFMIEKYCVNGSHIT